MPLFSCSKLQFFRVLTQLNTTTTQHNHNHIKDSLR
nr:MAG TPA: hypothetical protein [Caudoviricetes sp.]